ncbi:hypothetical protein [Amycolatopsis sp.]|uniref:hypothetical protein n=1 Tax=Amycolatopsis sp. TaxID=37632 RepID=UPI002D800122|nr:hypothetical protein [Amycolatopsis sp.]HET6707386.1 hypothetical protein [Amycolatopsis sp.]
MAAQVSADVRTLFADLGIEVEKTVTDLAIDRFEQWSDGVADIRPILGSICRLDVLEAA